MGDSIAINKKVRRPSWLLLAFFIALLLPFSFTVGGLRLTPLRVFLIFSIVPLFFVLIRQESGRKTWVDLLVILHAIWVLLALAVNHGAQYIDFAGMNAIELIGGYLLGRVLIRSFADFQHFVRIHFATIIVLSPFAIVELMTGKLVIPSFFQPIFETIQRGQSAYGRLGLERVYSVFDHPILFGLFCSMVIANLLFSTRYLRGVSVPFALGITFMSLSSAPLLSCVLQIGLTAWNLLSKGSWKTLVAIGLISFVAVDLMSNRTPFAIVAETLTFNKNSAWARINIWTFGTQSVVDNPIFGIGMNDWKRPVWLTASVDNFWLLLAMRYGLVGLSILVSAIILHFTFVSKANLLAEKARRIRRGYSIVLVATVFVLGTVHIWGSMLVFVMLYVGAGAWIYTASTVNDVSTEIAEKGGEPLLSVDYRRDPSILRRSKALRRPKAK